MRRTAGVCEHCSHVLTAAYVDGTLQPVGQRRCPECGGAEFAEPAVGDDAGNRGTG